MPEQFLNSEKLGKVLYALAPIQCIDIGARGVPNKDLLNIAPVVELYGFEPDGNECDRLNQQYSNSTLSPYRKIVFFPAALGRKAEKRTLYIMKHRGASSLLPPITEIGSQFLRNDYVTVESTCEIATSPLDEFLTANSLSDVSYAKIDVEGAELEVLQSAPRLLSTSLLSLRVEVSFLATRKGQPCYNEIEAHLRKHHFIPMDFLELHSWRRTTKRKPTKRGGGVIPYSKGQIVHGDMLFFLDPEQVFQRPMEHILKSAFIAMALGYMDHAHYLVAHSPARKYLEDKFQLSLEREFSTASNHFFKKYRQSKRMEFLRRIFPK